MVNRYGREVTGECQICGHKGETQIHHIISQNTIEKLKPGQHGHDLELRMNDGNLSELCVPCHRLTHSHFYFRWMESLDDEQFQKILTHEPKNGRRPTRTNNKTPGKNRRRSKRRKKHKCIGENRKGEQCGIRVATKDTFCSLHVGQASIQHRQNPDSDYRSKPMPPLRGWHDDSWEEPMLDGEEMACLQGIHQGWMEVDDYALELFAEWPEVWKRRWLYLEEW